MVQALSLIVVASALAVPPSGEDLARRFRDEAPRAQAGMIDRLAHVAVRGRLTSYLRDDLPADPSRITRSAELQIKTRQTDTLVIRAGNTDGADAPTPFQRLIYGRNVDEAFLLRQVDDRSPLRRLVGGQPERIIESYRQSFVEGLAGGVQLRERPLRERIREPKIVVDRAESVDLDDRAMVRIEFSYRDDSGNAPHVTTGLLIVSPVDHWAVREYQADTVGSDGQLRTHFSLVNHLGAACNGLPVVRRVTQTVKSTGAFEWSQREEFDIDEWSYVESPEREFRIPHYLKESGEAPGDAPR